MNLENTLKFHFAKSTMISDSPRATASDSLTGTDVMAAMGMTQERASMGYSAFLGKMGISTHDRDKAVDLLTQYAMQNCDKVSALRKLDPDVKPKVMQLLATFAFEDYSRSAASTRTCDCCNGDRFVNAEVMTMKYIGRPHLKEKRETVKVLCHKCKGKALSATRAAVTARVSYWTKRRHVSKVAYRPTKHVHAAMVVVIRACFQKASANSLVATSSKYRRRHGADPTKTSSKAWLASASSRRNTPTACSKK